MASRTTATVAATLLAAACSSSSKPTASPTAPAPTASAPTPTPKPMPTPPAGPPGVKVSLAEVGLEPASLDRSADPCVDFYQYSCGGWLSANQIPPDKARWGRFGELDEKVHTATKSLLEDDAKGVGSDAGAKKLGDYYAACMDTATVEKAKLASLPLFVQATKVKDAKSWQAAVAAIHAAGIDVVWGVGIGADLKDSTMNVTQLDAAGLGLPDRDYYLDAKFKDKVEAYRTHVGKMLGLAGIAKPDGAAADVLAIETEIAKLTKTRVEKRDDEKMYNPTDAAGLAKQAKSVDWKAYWKALDITPSKRIVEGTPAFFAALDGLRAKFKPAQWANYFAYHVAEHFSLALPKAFDDESFELKKALTGQPQQAERYKRCIDSTVAALGELLGQQYVAKYFPGKSKETAQKLVDQLLGKTMSEDLASLDWMSDATKAAAQQKRQKIVRMVGYPDKWKTYDFDVKRDDFLGDELRAAVFDTHRELAKAGKPVDRGEWHMNAYTVNAYYEPTANNTALPAGILQGPFFGQDRSIAANLGGIGMVIGHELTHGFDDQGAKFDADGNLKSWWQDADKQKFEAKGQCVADMYSSFEALPKQFVNGKLTLGEDIADLGGVKLAFTAYRELRAGADKQYVADGLTEDQQFFVAVGQAWCSKDRPEETERRLTVDPHAPPKFRIFGALRNLPEFAKAFSCAPGTPMAPANRCQVW